MPFRLRRALSPSRIKLAASLVMVIASVGCNSNQSSSQALDRQIKDNPQYKKENVAQFAGIVTVDGQPPGKDYKLFVILNDPKHLDANAHAAAPKIYTVCDPDGNFAFGTYDKADGVVVGKYVVTFVGLHSPTGVAPVGKSGPIGFRGGTNRGARTFKQPDELHNRYSDPDKNVKEDRFNVSIEPPGKSDNSFDLAVAGKDTAPVGPNAVTTITVPH